MKIRHKQLSFWSQVKMVAAASLFASIFIALAIFFLDRDGFIRGRSDRVYPVPVIVIGSLLIGALLSILFTLFQIAGLWLLRLLPWRGPALEVSETSPVRDIFE